jgi:hypothetical protein
MIRVEITEAFGPFNGMGGYGEQRGVGLHRKSVKRAVALAKREFNLHGKRHGGHFGGGVPVMGSMTVHIDGRLVLEKF